ncbi:MAG TPA: hypothetical protein VF733_05610 [Candidatus Saccharimonadales bacterium]
MDASNQSPPLAPSPVVAQPPNPASSPVKKPFYKQAWFIVLAIVAVVFLIGPILGLLGLTNKKTGSSPAQEQFYKMVETAGQKTRIRYTYELQRSKTADFPAVYARSMAEFDSTTKDYSLVFVSDSTTTSAGRCVKGQEYKAKTSFPDNLAEAEASLSEEWTPRDEDLAIGYCKYTTPRFQGSISDGVLPVGISTEQAKTMVKGLRGRGGVVYTDQGSVTYNGTKGRRIAFEISEAKTGSKHRANLFFYALRDGTSNKVAANIGDLDKLRDHFEDRFHQTSPVPELKGYYIIDQQTNLPLYSEITTTAGDISDFAPTTIRSVYGFPDSLTIDTKTPLPKINKPE